MQNCVVICSTVAGFLICMVLKRLVWILFVVLSSSASHFPPSSHWINHFIWMSCDLCVKWIQPASLNSCLLWVFNKRSLTAHFTQSLVRLGCFCNNNTNSSVSITIKLHRDRSLDLRDEIWVYCVYQGVIMYK